jgi:spore maturation protein SpmA
MTKPSPEELRQARTARQVAVVLVVTMALWLGAQLVGGEMGWSIRFAFLFDLAALAAFFWAMVVTFQIWRARRGQG